MSRAVALGQDPFQKMLLWSAVMHVALLAAFTILSRLGPQPSLLPEPSVAWVVPGVPGPAPGAGGGAPSTPPPPEPPKPEPPKKEEPRVVRPTKEEREQLPLPEAKVETRKPRPKQAPSGLTGRDAASAPSAQLKGQGPPGLPGLGLGGAGGGSPFDQDFEYAYYVQQMLGKIHQNWQRLAVTGTAVVVIRFTIFKDGHVENVEVETSSRVPLLDRAAERAVLLSDPMPPLPNSYPKDRVGVHLRFEYSDRY